MAVEFGKKNHKQNYIMSTMITAVLLIAVFVAMIVNLYKTAEKDAYEDLHVQTKQIKDDITLQLMSDRENLQTMASFAAKLYADGEDYSIMFDSFKAIGLIENIGILNPDNTFVTKAGSIDLDGRISFEDEAEKGAYISGRIKDLTREDSEIIRGAVPIRVSDDVVGILYGVIKLDKIGSRYNAMAKDIDAQLFIYDKENGKLVVDTVHSELGNISFLKDREYNDGYSYEQLETTDKGFLAFMSAYKNENLHLHYSTIDDIDWMIALGRYDSQVFAQTHKLTQVLFLAFFVMLGIISLYVVVILVSEKRINAVTECASDIRKELLEVVEGEDNILDALIEMRKFAKARSALFFNTEGDLYHYILPKYEAFLLNEDERKLFRAELFRYASEYRNNNSDNNSVNVLCIKPNRHMLKTNPSFHEFLKMHDINEVSFSAITSKSGQITILATLNSGRGNQVRMLAEKVSACFSMALYNKKHLSKTTIAATTDSLTGVFNRVAYKNDITELEKGAVTDFSCIYIDVNELHMCNNKYGHAVGDEMLVYIANSLKENFGDQKVYRIGGDEFLVLCDNTANAKVKESVNRFTASLKLRKYHVAIGMAFRSHCTNIDELIKEAEVRMYEAKALYYQKKERNFKPAKVKEYIQTKTGIVEIDTMISLLKEKYNGIYRVSLDTDKARRILMPAYLNYNENEEHYSKLFSKYVSESVDPNFHRAVLSFLNYEVLKKQLSQDSVPKIRYKKNNGENVILSVHRLCDEGNNVSETLWIFAKE